VVSDLAVYPDGGRVLVWGFRRGHGRSYPFDISLDDHRAVSPLNPEIPLAWAPDGTMFSLRGESPRTVWRIPQGVGEPQVHMELPDYCRRSGISISRDGTRAVCASTESVESDIWIARDFERSQ
jgi:hypothetical protein